MKNWSYQWGEVYDARTYFENNATDLSPLILTKNNTKGISTSTVDLKPQWEIATKSGHKNVSLIEIPLSSSTLSSVKGSNFENGKYLYARQMLSMRRLVIAKTLDGNIDMFIITVVPDMEWGANSSNKLNSFQYLGGGNFTGNVFCSTLEGKLVKGFIYENGKNIGPLQFKLKEDLTDEIKESLKDKDYISYSFTDIAKTKAGTYSFNESGGSGSGGMGIGDVIIQGKCSVCYASPCRCVKCFWCNNKRCTCTTCIRCHRKMMECTCYQYPGGGGNTGGGSGGSGSGGSTGGGTNPSTNQHQKTQTVLKNAAKTAVEKYATDAHKDSEGNYLARCNLGVQEAFKSTFGTNPFSGMNANSMVDKLASSSDWQKVQMSEVQKLANDGWFVIVGYKASSGSGHVAVIVPGEMTYNKGYGCNIPNTMDTGAGMRTESQKLSQSFGKGKKDSLVFYKYK